MKKGHKRLIIAGSIIGALALTIATMNIIPPKKVLNGETNPFIIEEGSRPMIAAHRGGKNLNPENTFKAIDYSVEHFDIDIIEMDLCLTKDNHLILNHNMTIDSSTEEKEVEGDYYVREHTLAELQTKNFGHNFKDKDGNYPYRNILDGVSLEDRSKVLEENKLRAVTIEELFTKYASTDMKYIIEIKNSGDDGLIAADKLVDAMEEYDVIDKVVIGTFHTEVESYVEETYPHVMRGASLGSAAGFIITQMLGVNSFYNATVTALQIPTSYTLKGITLQLAKKNYINRAHRRNISVQYWTINDKEEMRMLIEMGADVIMTDNPDVMYELLQEMGY